MAEEKRTAAQVMADQIIAMINDPSGVPSWRKPWTPPPGPNVATNASTERPYRGANALDLTFGGAWRGQPPLFATFNQWKEMGEKEGLDLFVKKGEKSTPILVPIFKKDEDKLDANGEPQQRLVGTKLAFVFHFSQVKEGAAFFERKYGNIPTPSWDTDTIWPVLKERIKEMVTMHEVIGDKAYYRPGSHEIFIPKLGQFPSEAAFYGTVLHELTHATEKDDVALQKAIVDNKLSDSSNGIGYSNKYAFCELRAELGALLLAQAMSLPIETDQSASYIESWGLKRFAENHRNLIVQAANLAQNAVDMVCTPEFLLALQERRNAAVRVPVATPHPVADLSITPADLEAGKRYTFTSDPGHGWLVVPVSDIATLGIAQDISPYSYLSPRGGKAYLEEDGDAPRFIEAYAQHYGLDLDTLWKKISVTHNIDREATCRSYDRFDPKRIPAAQVSPNPTMELPLGVRP
jgi:antirestriction protein ArdC